MRLQGAPNARDLGGLRTADGRRVRAGRLLRSGQLSSLTAEDLRTLQELSLETVVDFRTETERRQKPDRILLGVEYIHCPIIEESTMGITRETQADPLQSMVAFAAKCGGEAENMMAALYPPLVESPYSIAHYRQFFDCLLRQTQGALLYHCTAGKDRVGVGTMLLLTALGVPRETVWADYLLTNERIVPDTERMLAAAAQYTDDSAVFSALRAFDGARAEYLDGAWNSIVSRYGTVEAFLERELGVDPAERAALRERYLEEA